MVVCVYPHSGLFIYRWLKNFIYKTIPNSFPVIKSFRFAGYQLYCYSQPISYALTEISPPNIHLWQYVQRNHQLHDVYVMTIGKIWAIPPGIYDSNQYWMKATREICFLGMNIYHKTRN